VAELPDRARIVIVGGGVGGVGVAYHLARRGETDVLLVERAELTSGSTFHSAGLVGQLRADPALTRMNVHSVELYRELDAGWVESGSLKLASSPERLVEIRRQHGWAQRAGLPLELISADEARDLFPLMATDGVLGAAFTPTDGQIDPARLCTSLVAGARAAGVRIAQQTRVVDREDRIGSVLGRRLDGEAAVRLERRPDPLGPLGHLVRRDHRAHDRLGHDVVGEMRGAVDDTHAANPPSPGLGPARPEA